MNEQLIVKNFGPIKDATVDFKRVTVFIGPTGGGKSTLAKLAAIARNKKYYFAHDKKSILPFYQEYNIDGFFNKYTSIQWTNSGAGILLEGLSLNFSHFFENNTSSELAETLLQEVVKSLERTAELLKKQSSLQKSFIKKIKSKSDDTTEFRVNYDKSIKEIQKEVEIKERVTEQGKNQFALFFNGSICTYIPAERIFISSINSAWAGLIRDDIGLPKTLLSFANSFLQARDLIIALSIKFLSVKYFTDEGKDYVTYSETGNSIRIHEAASGIQSVAPLLVLLEHLSHNTEQAQSFIVEEPELNLFPIAQFELVKILIDKCASTEGINDLVLTTHSPYVLTSLNLLCYAYRIAQQDETTAKKVAKLIPRHCWIDPDQFAAYYVDRLDTKRKQQVRSIINKKTGLIEENELDTASDELGAIFDKLVRLRKPTQTPSRVK